MSDDRTEAFKLYGEFAKQLLTLSSSLLVAIVGATKLFGQVTLKMWPIQSAVVALVVSILSGLILLGSLVGNINGGKGIDAPEINVSGMAQLGSFFVAAVFVTVWFFS